MVGACTRCGTTIASGSTACPRCGAATTGSHPGEHAERIRLRLQESIGDAYRLVELLGRGGMGIVFRARELALDREVALKVLTLDPMLSPEAYARFEREAKLAARLDHPNVVPIFAVGQRNTVAFYTMRLVRGGTVEDMLGGHKALDFQHALDILRDVASALDYAHGQGVVHRDIKPANVLIGESGHVMVSDFGIARGLGVGDAPLGSGAVIGSPGYMSPEQWRGDEIDARADQYALGVVAFEMLTGHRPFETVRVQDLMKLHLTAEVPNASSVKSALPPFVDLSIRRALSKNRSERFTSATAFVDALSGKRPVSGLTRTSMKVSSPPEEPAASGIGGVVNSLLALVIVAGVVAAATIAVERRVGSPSRQPPPVAAVTMAPPDSVLSADTTFDVNAPAAANAASAAERRPVSVDPTLFPTRSGSVANNAPGYIRVLAHGGTARVRVDGRMYGFSPAVVRVAPGSHVVSLESSGDAFLPAQITISAVSNDTLAAIFSARVTSATPQEAPARDNDRVPLAPPSSGPTIVPSAAAPPPAAAASPSDGGATPAVVPAAVPPSAAAGTTPP
jgi:serine/threonine protein kinase